VTRATRWSRRIRKEYRNLRQLLPEIDLTEKDRETCSSKLERYEGSFGLNTDEYETLLFFDNTSEVSELLAGIVDIQKLLVSVSVPSVSGEPHCS
jgi:hypothetical protein